MVFSPSRRRQLQLTVAAAAALLAAASAARILRRRRRHKAARRVSLRFNSEYAAAGAREALAACGLAETTGDEPAPTQWGDFAALDWDSLLGGGLPKRLSAFYVRSGLVRKATLAHYMRKRKLLDGVLPETIVADIEEEEDLQALRQQLSRLPRPSSDAREGPRWVVKASTANRGEHLHVASTADEVVEAIRPAALNEGVSEWIVQRYVPPLLLDGRKFHVRAHLLVSGCPSCGRVSAFLHQEHAIVLVANEAYSPDLAARGAHLTNHCIQVESVGYEEAKCILPLQALDNLPGLAGLAQRVVGEMERCAAAALTAAASAPASFSPLAQCFELYGVDYTLEAQTDGSEPKVWLLEFNAGPDLAVFGERLRSSATELLSDTLRVAVLPHLEAEAACAGEAGPYRQACGCRRHNVGTGFGECLWSQEPRGTSAPDDMQKFKRRLSLAATFAKSMHEESGVPVRGSQAVAAAAAS